MISFQISLHRPDKKLTTTEAQCQQQNTTQLDQFSSQERMITPKTDMKVHNPAFPGPTNAMIVDENEGGGETIESGVCLVPRPFAILLALGGHPESLESTLKTSNA